MTVNKTVKVTKKAKTTSLTRLAAYKRLESSDGIAHRIAHFLHWAASNMPGEYFAYNMICKAINDYLRLPSAKSDEVETIRKSMQRVKTILHEAPYKRTYDYKPGVGVRACYSDNDAVKHSVARAANRLISSKAGLDKVIEIVNPNKLTGTEASYFKGVANTSKQITVSQLKALLPPANTEES